MKHCTLGTVAKPFKLLLALFLVSVAGCTRLQQYRTDLSPCKTSVSDPATCEHAAIEETPSYLLGFVEVDDQGWLFQREQLKTVLDRINQEEKKNRLLIVTFVHGWKHNAKTDDTNVEMLRKNLRILNLLERSVSRREGRPTRKIVGVYCGWRGLSQTLPVLKDLTFWERKNTAHEVGRGALGEVFMKLEDIRNESHLQHINEPSQTRLIIVGHSFGGAATYSALSSLLTERAVHDADHSTEGRFRFADLVMLVNPAFEAARFEVLQEAARTENGATSNQVSIAIFTSKRDDATKIAFPLGRHFSTLFDKYKDDFEKKANVTAVGHFQPFITHDLIDTTGEPMTRVTKSDKKSEEVASNTEATADRVLALREQVRASRKTRIEESIKEEFHFDGSDLRPRPGHDPQFPLYVVSVDPKIIPDHNGIDTKQFLRFLGQFVLAFLPPD